MIMYNTLCTKARAFARIASNETKIGCTLPRHNKMSNRITRKSEQKSFRLTAT